MIKNIHAYTNKLIDIERDNLLLVAYNSLLNLDGLDEAEAAKRRQSPRMQRLVDAVTPEKLHNEAERMTWQIRDIWIGDLQDRYEATYGNRIGTKIGLLLTWLEQVDLWHYTAIITGDMITPDEVNTSAANILAVLRWYTLLNSGRVDHLFDLSNDVCASFIERHRQPIQLALF